ncbi:MAG: hypothetical protein FJX76_15880 [Armatimonadetes bacterium]|nr:hypothetical protein [Armatimonadota bacterium]
MTPVSPRSASPSVPADAVTLSGVTASSSGTVSQPAPMSFNPLELLQGIARYVRDRATATEEPPELHGLVFMQRPDGSMVDLKLPGTTTPDIPPGGPDIPAEAVKNNRVVIYVDGIQQPRSTQEDQIRRLFLAQGPSHGANVDQPVIAIHEGVGKTIAYDVSRIACDWMYLKALQTKMIPVSWVRKKIYRLDAVVKPVHDEIRQSLAAGRDVQLIAHSGGGCETALALTMLSREDGGRWKNLIRNHVKVLALAPGAAKEDYELAGVKPENVFYTGSKMDPLWHFAENYIHPSSLPANVKAGVAGLQSLRMVMQKTGIPQHSPDYIFWRNMDPAGGHHIQRFFDGTEQGGKRELP